MCLAYQTFPTFLQPWVNRTFLNFWIKIFSLFSKKKSFFFLFLPLFVFSYLMLWKDGEKEKVFGFLGFFVLVIIMFYYVIFGSHIIMSMIYYLMDKIIRRMLSSLKLHLPIFDIKENYGNKKLCISTLLFTILKRTKSGLLHF